MKKFYFAVILLFSFFLSTAAPVNRLLSNGGWTNGNWSLNRLPASGDTVLIPAGITLTFNNDMNLQSLDIYIKVEGIIQMNKVEINFGGNAILMLVSDQAAIVPIRGGANNRINIGGQNKYRGNEGTVYGPAYISRDVSHFTAVQDQTLPVKFISFTVANENNGVIIRWVTAEEVNARVYNVERSDDGIHWSTIGHVTAVGNSQAVNNYSFKDYRQAGKIAYYRIRQTDIDGRFTYTAIKTITPSATASANPAMVHISATPDKKVLVQFGREVNGQLRIQFISLSGQVLEQQQVSATGRQLVINNVTALKGTYVVVLSGADNLKIARQVTL